MLYDELLSMVGMGGTHGGPNITFSLTAEELMDFVKKMAMELSLATTPVKENDNRLTRKDVSRIMGVTEQTVINWERSGKIRGVQQGGRYYYSRSDIEALKMR